MTVLMASLTFGSVGDIITVCKIIIDVVKAVSESRGSATDYQGLIRELWGLAQTLEGISSLLEEYPQLRNNGNLRDLLEKCKICLDTYLEQIKSFESSLAHSSSKLSPKHIYRKVAWISRKAV